MAWLAMDSDGFVHIFIDKPERVDGLEDWYTETDRVASLAYADDVEYLIGRKLTPTDDPVEI